MAEQHQRTGQASTLPGIYTETLARLYAAQGLYDQALTIYRQLLQQQPENQALLTKIAALEQRMTEATAPRYASGIAPPVRRERPRAAQAHAHQVVVHLERWLAQLRRQCKRSQHL
jgi:hypothetical protein